MKMTEGKMKKKDARAFCTVTLNNFNSLFFEYFVNSYFELVLINLYVSNN